MMVTKDVERELAAAIARALDFWGAARDTPATRKLISDCIARSPVVLSVADDKIREDFRKNS